MHILNRTKWTETQVKWLIENRYKVSLTEGAKILNVPKSSYSHKAYSLGLTRRSVHEGWIKMERFTNVKDPVVAYVLGFMWADGSLRVRPRGNDNPYFSMTIGCIASDLESLKHLFQQTGRFYESDVWPSNGGNLQLHLSSLDQAFGRFLYEHDYHTKSHGSPDKILAHIPEHLHSSFWHGFLDGDGCIHIGNSTSSVRVSFAGSYDQDWTALNRRFDQCGVKYSVARRQRVLKNGKTHRHSTVSISGKTNVVNALNYILSDSVLGLERKRRKAEDLYELMKKTVIHKGRAIVPHPSRKGVVRSDGKTYPSAMAATEDIGCSLGRVSGAIARGQKAGGYSFAWVTSPDNDIRGDSLITFPRLASFEPPQSTVSVAEPHTPLS